MSESSALKVAVSDGGGVPAGNYTAKFANAEYLAACDADPMTGKGGRQYDAFRFTWEVVGGDHGGKMVTVETPRSTGVKSRWYSVVTWLLGGRPPQPGEVADLTPCVGKKYLITLGSRPGKQWVEVVNAMLSPQQ